MEAEQVIIKPLITEKAVRERERGGYVFSVALSSGKIEIKRAVEKIFKVKVMSVNTCYVRGKQRAAKGKIGRTSRWKKAYVTLRAGQKIQELEA
ncbi:50S ribosomal protein L23 [Candidatus Saganbacteria bacterium]|uniref:Large ribosomal subunit protein uL23 n=1 Tax=Candidatus Saganbacteria bacterium TaxID=2575572 RepID=A0A9D6YVZ7_UNCSA|nr:50S ribosomal protein L23 [Candidatus Saganbacteria bacterium]